jgi:hypothetical protein
MYRNLLVLAFAGAISACSLDGSALDSGNDEGVGTGEQPLVGEEQPTDVPDEPSTGAASSVDVFGADLNADLRMNEVIYDPDTDELLLNNIPFDGDDGEYARDAAGTAGLASAGSGFGAYRNTSGQAEYYAVFRRSDNAYSQVVTAGTDRYFSFGFGGAAALRLDGTGALPNANQSYVFNGEYAGVRTILDESSGTSIQYVAGTAQIDVDIEDFDTVGAVEGLIVDRRFFDANGVQVAGLNDVDYIALHTAQINFDDWTISSSTATVRPQLGQREMNGSWEGLFAGPNGEEVAGIIVVEGDGPVGIDPTTGDYIVREVRETGGFVATR